MEEMILVFDDDDGAQVDISETLHKLGFEVKEIPSEGRTLENLPYFLIGAKEYHGKDEIVEFIKEEREKNKRK